MNTVTIYTDPGHGWMEVPRTMLNELGIAGMITQFSYQKGEFAYLEEDCDLATFWMAYRAKHGSSPKFITKETNTPSPIRKYRTYSTHGA